MITKKFLHEIFDYKNGCLYWKVKFSRKINIGQKAGCDMGNNYFKIVINKKKYLSHRLIYLYHYGYMPEVVDHINKNSTDNRIENLREATFQQNQYNRKLNKNSSTGIKNVYWNKKTNKWSVRFTIEKKLKHFGCFDNFESAKLISQEIRNKYHGKFASYL
jgi:hypothetical protein